MGGKQKRAAKYKKWIESQTLLQQLKESKERQKMDKDKLCYSTDGGGCDYDCDFQRMHPKVRQEVNRNRLRKLKRTKSNEKWCSRIVDNLASSRTCTVLGALMLAVGLFFFCRFVVQFFILPATSGLLESSPIFTRLQEATPKPIWKMMQLTAYILGSKELSFRGIYDIVYPPEPVFHRYY